MTRQKNPQLAFYVSLLENAESMPASPPKYTWGTPDCLTDHKIIVTHVDPPIPNGKHVVAYSDNLGADCSPYGTGPDAASAIEDLIWQLEDME